MKTLFNDELAPVTSEIGFIECSAEKAVESFLGWQQPIQAKRGVSLNSKKLNGALRDALISLAPLTSVERRRMVFVPANNNWTAYFDNGWRGADAFSTISFLAKKMEIRGVRARYTPHTLSSESGREKGRYGSILFELFGKKRTDFLNVERSVALAYDGNKWIFTASGVPQSFEKTERYAIKSIVKRFSLELLDEYLNAIGIDAFNEDFYCKNNEFYFVEKVGPAAPNMCCYSLEESRSDF